jgi:lipoteichoic acid synthase
MVRKIGCLTLSLIIILIYIRTKVYGYNYLWPLLHPKLSKEASLLSYEDILLAVGSGVLFWLFAIISINQPKMQKVVYGTFIFFNLLYVIWALINVYALKVLGVPINYQMFYYADLMDSRYILKSIAGSLSWRMVAEFPLMIILMLGLGYLFNYILLKISVYRRIYLGLLSCLGVGILCYFIAARNYAEYLKYNNHYVFAKMANPVLAFAKSFHLSFQNENNIFKNLPNHVSDSFLVRKRNNFTSNATNGPSHPRVKNVILYVMESVAAEYVAGYEGTYKATPQIERHLSESMVFKDVYAHSPQSTNSLFSLLGSAYPLISFKILINEHPEIKWPTLSSVLKKQNYKTAFFQASDNTYMRVDEFLSYRSFDKVLDHRQMPCTSDLFTSAAVGVGEGQDEGCMVNAFSDWLTRDVNQQPFFAMLWTIQTHWPYFVFGPEKDFGVKNAELNRYLNALNQSDAALGKLLDDLKQKGLSESTLVIVVGDHGEAFGQHRQTGHGTDIYEENVRVPLIFINPLLFNGQEKSVVGGHVDVAATILDILNLKAPQEWQGTSLFDASRVNIAYFFSTWTDYFFGYRTPKHKVILNAYANKTMIFDMHQDPKETVDLAVQKPELVKSSYKSLAQWIQYNRTLMNTRLKK